MAFKMKGFSGPFKQNDYGFEPIGKGSYSDDGKIYFPPAASRITRESWNALSEDQKNDFFKRNKLESDTTTTTTDHGGGVTGTKTVITNSYVPTNSKKGWRKRRKNEAPFKQDNKGADKMMKKEVQIKKKPNLKNMTTDALVDSLYNISQRPYQGDDSEDAKNFAAYKAEVLRREPDFDWGMNVDEMD
tara:strand:+ start:1394 stop:1957 length:564 start_codon:yes stop_codon:yes gene_type:complete